MSRVDHFYRRLLLSKFFTKGWGKPDNLKRIFDFRKIMADRELCKHVVPCNYPIHIDTEYPDGDFHIMEGHFTSPFTVHLPDIMPKEVETATAAYIRAGKLPLLPLLSSTDSNQISNDFAQTMERQAQTCVYSLSGDRGSFFLEKAASDGKAFIERPWDCIDNSGKSILCEFGKCKTWQDQKVVEQKCCHSISRVKAKLEDGQKCITEHEGVFVNCLSWRSSLHNVSDLFVMGGALMMESVALLHWCKKQGYGPLGLTGISMGGHMASLAATNWQEPVSLIPCLSWSTASVAFTQGVLSGAIPWKTLETQFFENSIYQDEISKLIVSPEDYFRDPAYVMGQQFVKDFSSHYDNLQKINFINRGSPENNPSPDTDSAPCPEPVSSPVMQEDANENMHQAAATTAATTIPIMQASVGSIPYPGNTTLPSQSYHPRASAPSATSKSPLSLQHALSKSKLSCAAVVHSDSPPLKSSLLGKQSTPHGRAGPATSAPHSLKKEAVNFMIGVMDECTHLANFPVPVDPRLIIIVAAQDDAYIPRHGVVPLNKLWPGSEVRYLAKTGHIAAFVFHNSFFRLNRVVEVKMAENHIFTQAKFYDFYATFLVFLI